MGTNAFPDVRLVIADVDGTLLTPDKILTARARRAVAAIVDAGIAFTVTSGRPPLGMRTLIDDLRLQHAIAAYLDVTHPKANKGEVVDMLSALLKIPIAQIATIGDMPNDVAMFQRSGLSIAMANASADVQHAAGAVTASNAEDGFAEAMERFVLPPRSVR
jgi:hydroxymethylpyrimidine pyrophosphatase-like HAD family hydrolase